MEEIKLYILIFFIYAIAGWIMETTTISIRNKKFVNRGFLVGPICPIYGYGVVLVSVLLKKYQEDMVATFCMSIIICGLLEYFTSFFMEKIFKARWWDYSQKKFNINGRICLENLVLFGIASCIIVYIVNPFIIGKINLIPQNIQSLIIIILLLIHVVDNIISYKIILNLKQVSKEVKDNTIEISEKVRKIIHNKSIFHRRLVDAFPNIKDKVEFKKWTLKEKIENLKRK
ncbi:MAG: putative ABC transporter permease [Clostridia bacterium]